MPSSLAQAAAAIRNKRSTNEEGNVGNGSSKGTQTHQDQHKRVSKTKKKKMCRFGAKCRNPITCSFQHPALPSSLTIKSQQQRDKDHVSEITTNMSPDDGGHPSNDCTWEHKEELFYRFCSPTEYRMRQELHQISLWEATPMTAHLPMSQRTLDPTLAVRRYHRSVAPSSGICMDDDEDSWSLNRDSLQGLLEHLADLSMMALDKRSSTYVEELADFLIDRLRACQTDATRLLGRSISTAINKDNNNVGLPPWWHVQMARLLLWIRYWTAAASLTNNNNISNNNGTLSSSEKQQQQLRRQFVENKEWKLKTLHIMIVSALDQYWETKQQQATADYLTKSARGSATLDDEVLSYMAYLRLAKDDPSTHNQMLLDFGRYATLQKEQNMSDLYPLWNQALTITSKVSRGEYSSMIVWRQQHSWWVKCALAPLLPVWKYRTIQYYNGAFAKLEVVHDFDRLLQLTVNDDPTTNEKQDNKKNHISWCLHWIQQIGLPIATPKKSTATPTTNQTASSLSPSNDEDVSVICKQVTLPPVQGSMTMTTKPHVAFRREDEWLFANCSTATTSSSTKQWVIQQVMR